MVSASQVPIIKAGIRDDITGTILNVDICLGVASGLHAVRMIAEQVGPTFASLPGLLQLGNTTALFTPEIGR